jgi:hypothetical protein
MLERQPRQGRQRAQPDQPAGEGSASPFLAPPASRPLPAARFTSVCHPAGLSGRDARRHIPCIHVPGPQGAPLIWRPGPGAPPLCMPLGGAYCWPYLLPNGVAFKVLMSASAAASALQVGGLIASNSRPEPHAPWPQARVFTTRSPNNTCPQLLRCRILYGGLAISVAVREHHRVRGWVSCPRRKAPAPARARALGVVRAALRQGACPCPRACIGCRARCARRLPLPARAARPAADDLLFGWPERAPAGERGSVQPPARAHPGCTCKAGLPSGPAPARLAPAAPGSGGAWLWRRRVTLIRIYTHLRGHHHGGARSTARARASA